MYSDIYEIIMLHTFNAMLYVIMLIKLGKQVVSAESCIMPVDFIVYRAILLFCACLSCTDLQEYSVI